jgi:hypothetical protein
MKLKDWFINQTAALTIAFSSVEKNLLGQNGKKLEDNTEHEVNKMRGTLADALKKGEITQEVKDLRWRTYKVLKASDKKRFISKSEDDFEIITIDEKKALKKVKVDKYDDYPLELVFNNILNTSSLTDVFENTEFRETIKDEETTYTLDGFDYFARIKNEPQLTVVRDFVPKYFIEKYTKKLFVRVISTEKRLLEFYVSKYGDEYDVNNKNFLNEVKRAINGGVKKHNFLQINEVGFISYNTLGVSDFLMFGYNVLSFDKIIEHDGFYVIKFIAEIKINGEDMLKEFVEKELEEKYIKKEAKL